MDTDKPSNDSGNNKIVWKRSAVSDTNPKETSPGTAASVNIISDREGSSKSQLSADAPHSDVSPLDLSAKAALHQSQKPTQSISEHESASISDLKSEIEEALLKADTASSAPQDQPELHQPIDLEASQSELQATDPAGEERNPDPVSPIGEVTQQNHEALMDSIKNDIAHDLETPSESQVSKNHGVEQTYYSDLSNAMKSNDPAMISELIQKSRFEKKESRIRSPRARKNILYMTGALVLLLASLGLLSLIFSPEPKVEFITESRVDSLVYSNLDTGINFTGLEASRAKQAIREVIETKIPDNTVNQIYYAQGDGLGNLTRLGIKDAFTKTDISPPELLLENIENDVMHGVYRAEKNYPFLILKAKSYDRAFLGMKEWEATIIDDLSPYLDLPEEAGDRSLISQGFEDDLIKNKNVRVARFLPREVDRRGILDFLKFGSDNNEVEPEESQNPSPAPLGDTVENTGTVSILRGIFLNQDQTLFTHLFSSQVFAQTTLEPESELNPVIPPTSSGGNPFTTESQSTNTTRICYNDAFPGQTFDMSYEGQQGYYCVNVISQGTEISQITRTAPVCFDPVSGQRLDEETQSTIGGGSDTPYGFCFPSYQCKRVACMLNGVEVSSSQQGQPGVICGQETSDPVEIDADVPKVCRQFNDLLRLENINNGLLCFSAQGQYLPNYTQSDSSQGVTCVTPLSRGIRMCVTPDNIVFNPDIPDGIGIEAAEFCFEPLNGRLADLDMNKPCSELTTIEVQQRLAKIGYELRFIATLAEFLNFSDADVDNIKEASQLLISLSRKNILQVEEVREVTATLQRLEYLLDTIDPNLELPVTGPNGGLNVYGFLRTLIETVKCTLGIANTLQWITLERIPQGMTIYSGQTLPEVMLIQQSLALMGLMDPISVTGTLDLVTQDAVSQFQLANGLKVTGIIDNETALLINAIIESNAAVYPQNGVSTNSAIINDYFSTDDVTVMGLGTYNIGVQNLQIILYSEGYDIPVINGLFDESTCEALQQYQQDNGLEVSDDINCTVSNETLESFNNLLRVQGLLGSGYQLNPQGYLEGTGKLKNTFGPGVDYVVNSAEADSLSEGDIVLMYMFLDEETILITRDEIVIEEVIKRRAMKDILS